MKDPLDRTKVVLRHLPPTLSESALVEQIDGRFAGRYKWFCFRSGKYSHKHQRYSRAYVDFKSAEDVVEFAEFFDGHVFLNEKGTQYKTIVEYAPSQRVPKPWSKKDGREGTILKDPEYLEFLELIAKPVENLPSAEIQLERREAERAGAPKETPIVTPLMDFVRQKRAAKGVRSSSNGKISRRSGGASSGNSSSASTKRGSEKRRVSTSVYVMRDSAKNTSGKEKSVNVIVPRLEDRQSSDKSVFATAAAGTEALDDGSVASIGGSVSGVTDAADMGKKRVILLKGKDREISQTSGGILKQLNETSSVRNSPASTPSKQNQRREAGGKMIRNLLINKEARQGQSSMAVQSEQQGQTLVSDKDKRPPRPSSLRSVVKEHISSVSQAAYGSDCDTKSASDDKISGNDLYGFGSTMEKQEKRTRNKDRPDRGVWTPLRRSEGLHASDESLSSSASQTMQLLPDSLEGMAINEHDSTGVGKTGDDVMGDSISSYRSSISGGKSRVGRGSNSSAIFDLSISPEVKVDMPNTSRSGDAKPLGSGRISYPSMENGIHRHAGRRGPHVMKDADGSLSASEGKPSKRGGSSGYGSHEKQIWVQKSGSGS